MAKLVSKAYGDALFETALEEGTVEELYEQVQELAGLLKENPQLMEILKHPDIDEEEKQSVLSRVFSGWMIPSFYSFCRLLVSRDRISELPRILSYLEERYKAYKKIGVVFVTSPTELTAVQKKQIEQKLLSITEFVSLEVQYQTDASLIGGLVIRIGDRVVDSSIRTRLEKMTRQLKNIQIK